MYRGIRQGHAMVARRFGPLREGNNILISRCVQSFFKLHDEDIVNVRILCGESQYHTAKLLL